jgi:hypothetical protein
MIKINLSSLITQKYKNIIYLFQKYIILFIYFIFNEVFINIFDIIDVFLFD